MRIGWLCVVLMLLSHAVTAGLPRLSNILPVAGQRGQTVEVRFNGERLHDATTVLFHTKGIAASELIFDEKNKDKVVKTSFTIAPDAPVGEHQIRLVTKTGVTEMFTFRVTDRPIVNEQRDQPTKNNKKFTESTSFENPQPIELGVAVLGAD